MSESINESKSDWYKAQTGHTVRLATQGTFGTFTGLPRGTMEQMNRACNRFFKSRNIVIKDLRQLRTEQINKRRAEGK